MYVESRRGHSAGIATLERQVALLKERNVAGVPVRLGVQTNATLLDASWADFFQRHDIEVGVSIDGPRALHDSSRRTRAGQGTFESAVRGVQALRVAGIPFVVIAVVTRYSFEFADQLLPFFADLGAEAVAFNVEEIENANIASSLALPELDGHLDTFWRGVLAGGTRLDRPLSVREIDNSLLRIAGGVERTDEQHVLLGIVSCDSRGRLSTFSPELMGARDPEYGDFVFGDVHEIERLEDIGLAPAAQRIEHAIAAGVEKCKRVCKYFSICGGGVPSNKYFEHGRFDTDETLFCRSAIQAPARAALAIVEATT